MALCLGVVMYHPPGSATLTCMESVSAKSANGSVEFLGGGVVVKSKGSTVTVPLDRVQGVEFKPAGLMAGFLRVNVAGAADVRARNKTQQIQRDTHAVQFSRSKLNAEFEAVADAINAALLSRA